MVWSWWVPHQTESVAAAVSAITNQPEQCRAEIGAGSRMDGMSRRPHDEKTDIVRSSHATATTSLNTETGEKGQGHREEGEIKRIIQVINEALTKLNLTELSRGKSDHHPHHHQIHLSRRISVYLIADISYELRCGFLSV